MLEKRRADESSVRLLLIAGHLFGQMLAETKKKIALEITAFLGFILHFKKNDIERH